MLHARSQGDERWAFLRCLSVFLIPALLLVVGGCDGIGSDANNEPNFTTEVSTQTLTSGEVNVNQIDEGQYADLVEGTQTVLRNVEEFNTFWAKVHTDEESVPNQPNVNFENQVVVAIVMGGRPTGGYNVGIDQVMASEDGEQMRVEYTETAPGDECNVTQAQTSPYVLVMVEAQDENFEFERTEETRNC